jgi:hypothetical protein
MYREDYHQDFTEVKAPREGKTRFPEEPAQHDEHDIHRKSKVKIKELIDGTILVREDIRKQLPYVLFLTFLGIIYIGNRFYTERVVRQISEIKTEVTNLRAEQITTTAELMNISRPSEVAALVKERNLGLAESVEPPMKLVKK